VTNNGIRFNEAAVNSPRKFAGGNKLEEFLIARFGHVFHRCRQRSLSINPSNSFIFRISAYLFDLLLLLPRKNRYFDIVMKLFSATQSTVPTDLVNKIAFFQYCGRVLPCGLGDGQVIDKDGERGRNRIRTEMANKALNRAQLATSGILSLWWATN
jgi:hypothetical protein